MAYENLQSLNQKHKRMISLVLDGRYNHRQIAEIVDLTPQAVTMIIATGIFQNALVRRRERIENIENETLGTGIGFAREYLEREALPSAVKLAELRDGCADPNIQRQSANDLLKHAFARENAQAGSNVQQVMVMKAEQVTFLRQVIKEAGLENEANGNGHADTSGSGDVAASSQTQPLLPG